MTVITLSDFPEVFSVQVSTPNVAGDCDIVVVFKARHEAQYFMFPVMFQHSPDEVLDEAEMLDETTLNNELYKYGYVLP